MTAFSQPSPQRLDRWLEHNPSRFERYLAAHPDVADLYENRDPLGARAREALAAAVEVPFGLAARLRDRLSDEHDTSFGAVGLDLLGLGLATAQMFIEPEPPEDVDR